MSDTDAEDVVEAAAPSGGDLAQTRAVAVSLAFSEGCTRENDEIQRHTWKRRHTEQNRDARQ
jgi:hypothetical protein